MAQNDSLSNNFSTADSNSVYYYYLNDLTPQKLPEDKLTQLQIYNPVLQDEFDHRFLGNFGSPHYSLVYQPRYRRGFDLGYHSYDGYLLTQSDVPFYNSLHPYTDAFYTAKTQVDGYIKVKFAQNYAPRSNLHIAYNRIGQQGGYSQQQVRHTNYITSTQYRGPKDNYMLFLSWAGNTIKQKNNGGIQDSLHIVDTLFIGNRDIIPVNLSAAQTEYDNHEITATQFFSFGSFKKTPKIVLRDTTFIKDTLGQVIDTILKIKRTSIPTISQNPYIPQKAFVKHQISYKQEKIKFFDDAPATEEAAAFYGPFLVNERGLRHFINVTKLENQVSLLLNFKKAGIDSIAKNNAISIEPGFIHALYRVNQEPKRFTRNDLFLTGKLNTNLKEYLALSAYGQFGFGANVGEYLLRGKIKSTLNKNNSIEVLANQQLYNPSLIQERFYLSQTLMWKNDLKKTLESNIAFEFTSTKLDLQAGFRYHVITNLVVMDETGFPLQHAPALNIVQVYLRKNFQLGKFHLNNLLTFQELPTDFIALPRISTRHSWYFESKFFNKKRKSDLLGRIGLDIRYNTNYFANSYSPVSGQFHLQDIQLLTFYPEADYFMLAKVHRFKMFFKIENLTQLITQKTYLTSLYHPARDWSLRFGLAWTFID